MNNVTEAILEAKFRSFYKSAILDAVPELESREIGFRGFNWPMRRHHQATHESIIDDLMCHRPAHVYHSTSKYTHPSERSMENKDRQSTDLVFDIDDRDNMVWAIAKTKMLYRLLTEDFGFSQILMNFSGSKGFHVRVYDMEIQRLDAEERREIVDYIELIGVEAEGDLFAVEQSGKEFKINFKNTPIDPGRRSWVFRTFQEEVNAIEKMDDAGRAKFMESFGKKASRPFNNAIKSGAMSQGINRGYLWIKSYYPEMWGSLFKMLMEKSRPHIDVPVTVDLHRLIRFPGTLHGGTGFRAKVLDMDQLEKFNPFRDAIAFGETPTRAQVKNNIQLPQLELKLPKGDHVVPEYVAVYLACKDQAEIIPMQ